MYRTKIEDLEYHEIISESLKETRRIDLLFRRVFGDAHQIVRVSKDEKKWKIMVWASNEEMEEVNEKLNSIKSDLWDLEYDELLEQ